jgi:cytochrome b6-f complex iron-sulfur subunit
MPSSSNLPRRGFLEYLLGFGLIGTVVSALYPMIQFLIPPRIAEAVQSNVVAGKTGELKPNSAKIFQFGSKPGILVYTDAGDFKAFSATCTHLDCTVQYDSELHIIWCACHNGQYDLNGKNIGGPPPRPLSEYAVHIRGEEIVVERI